MANNEPAFYEDRRGRLQPTKSTSRLFRMFDAQLKEITDTMQVFDHLEYSLKIAHETRGVITATVRDLASAEMLYTVRFAKKNRQGAIYTFRDAERLSLLGFEPDKIVIDHRAEKLRKIGEEAQAKGLDPDVARQAEIDRARPLSLIDQLDFFRDFALAFALAAQARLPGSVLVSVRKPAEPSPTTRAKPDERVHVVLDLGNDRWLDATGVRSREKLVKALGVPNAVFHAETPDAVAALRRDVDPARLLDAEQTLDAKRWRPDSLPSSNGALAAQRTYIEQARSIHGPRKAPFVPRDVEHTVVATSPAAQTTIRPVTAPDAMFNADELADDPFRLAPTASHEALELRAVAEAPATPSIGRRTPIGQRHAPWRQR